MKIVLKNEAPIYSPPGRISVSEHNEVERQIEKWLRKGMIPHLILQAISSW